MSRKRALLLVNIGSPESFEVKDVKSYLRKFLMDPFVLQMPRFFRWLLVYVIISPFRSPKTAEKYKSVWQAEGSPLMVESQRLTKALSKLWTAGPVRTAMMYSSPSLPEVLKEFQKEKIEEVLFVPFYPQYAESSTKAAWAELEKILVSLNYRPQIFEVPDFFSEPEFIQAWTERIQQNLRNRLVDHYLFSFHGLPKSHLKNEGCLKTLNCCEQVSACAKRCYRAQSIFTAKKIAESLGLKKNQWSIGFQSRLGREPWITPFTDHILKELSQKGTRSLAVACPSFVVDCLETVQEIKAEGRELFLQSGGHELVYIPCLNDLDSWVQGLAKILERNQKTKS